MNHSILVKNFVRFSIIACIFVIACRIEVPVKTMADAKATITRAIEVKAEKYAPDELKNARDLLMKSHEDLLVKKDEKAAAVSAQKSYTAATNAVAKSLPLLSKDTLDEAKKINTEADLLHAKKYSTAEFDAATALIAEAETLHTGTEYWKAYLKSTEAITTAKNAREKALTFAPEVKKAVDDLKAETEALKTARGSDFAAEEIKTIGDGLTEAETNITANNLKNANAKIDDAKKTLEAAKTKTMKGIAAEKLGQAEKALETAQGSKAAELYKADIEKAAGLIKEGKELNSAASYKESIAKSDEAIALLTSTSTAMSTKLDELKKTASEKIEASQNALKKVEESAAKADFKGDIDAIKTLMATAKEQFDKEQFADSIKNSDGAIEKINSLLIALEKKIEEKRIAKKEPVKEEKAIEYTVKYNPKNRDCLWKIAQSVYKDAKLWPWIYVANKDKIKDPDLIFPGQKFIIPKDINSLKKSDVKSTDKKADDKEASKDSDDTDAKKEEKKSDAE